MSPNFETQGYCPECGRGDCSPTAEQWSAQVRRAEAAEGELIRLRNRIAALEANGAELLARAETAELELGHAQGTLSDTRREVDDLTSENRGLRAELDRTRHLLTVHGYTDDVLAALDAPQRSEDTRTGVSAGVEASGGAGEAQGG